jgi:hypothetical protein
LVETITAQVESAAWAGIAAATKGVPTVAAARRA